MRKLYIGAYTAILVIGFLVMLWAWDVNGRQPGGDGTANLVVIACWLVSMVAISFGIEQEEDVNA